MGIHNRGKSCICFRFFFLSRSCLICFCFLNSCFWFCRKRTLKSSNLISPLKILPLNLLAQNPLMKPHKSIFVQQNKNKKKKRKPAKILKKGLYPFLLSSPVFHLLLLPHSSPFLLHQLQPLQL